MHRGSPRRCPSRAAPPRWRCAAARRRSAALRVAPLQRPAAAPRDCPVASAVRAGGARRRRVRRAPRPSTATAAGARRRRSASARSRRGPHRLRPGPAAGPRRAAAARLLTHLARQLLGLLAKRFLLSRQLLQLPLHFLRGRGGVRELALPAVQLLLTLRKVANLVERALALLTVGARVALRSRLVVGALLALKLLVEERRQILALPAESLPWTRPPAAPLPGGVPRPAPAASPGAPPSRAAAPRPSAGLRAVRWRVSWPRSQRPPDRTAACLAPVARTGRRGPDAAA